ncbi:hypothetical protein HBB04_00385 [Pseudomonas coronafaciens]|nr:MULTISPECIES: hypothetical protein [Pseudomonas syringae group]QIQ70041.1 hypothetical protein HBB04_00385 [Pseudomonas coronafaciens]
MREMRECNFSDGLAVLQGDLAATFTPVSLEETGRILLDQFGIKADLTRFDTEKGNTFRCDSADGKSVVLKIANPQDTPVELSLQVAVDSVGFLVLSSIWHSLSPGHDSSDRAFSQCPARGNTQCASHGWRLHDAPRRWQLQASDHRQRTC